MQAKPNLSIIVAVAPDLAIGRHGDLLYHVSADLRRFKALTTGHTIIMGRRTFESLPKGALPNRRNIVLSTTVSTIEGCDVYRSLDEALHHCNTDDHIYIIGGASVYSEAISRADRLCLTEVDDTPAQADTFFPDYSGWKEEKREDHETDDRHAFRYSFVDYVK